MVSAEVCDEVCDTDPRAEASIAPGSAGVDGPGSADVEGDTPTGATCVSAGARVGSAICGVCCGETAGSTAALGGAKVPAATMTVPIARNASDRRSHVGRRLSPLVPATATSPFPTLPSNPRKDSARPQDVLRVLVRQRGVRKPLSPRLAAELSLFGKNMSTHWGKLRPSYPEPELDRGSPAVARSSAAGARARTALIQDLLRRSRRGSGVVTVCVEL
jgi:hypothetical protein